jgi:hypothetical protein
MEVSAVRRLVVALMLTAALATEWAGAPSASEASCAGLASLEDVAEEPGSAVFTGWAAGRVVGSQDLVFVVDRWYHGRHAAREIRLLGSTAFLAEPEARGPVGVALAEATAGDAVPLDLDEPVFMVAEWLAAERVFAVRFCTLAGLPLASEEGQSAIAEARATFGRGRPAADLPDTGAMPSSTLETAAPALLPEWWLPVLALAFAASIVLVNRQVGRSRRRFPRHRPEA